jgi:prephenate dehydrogenase
MMTDQPRLLPMAPPPGEGTPPVFERIAIVGLGLVGGSLALAAREAWPSGLVIGVDRNDVLEQAMVRHAIDVAAEDLMIVSEADLVVLAAPVQQNLAILAELPGRLSHAAIVTDVGSAKRAIVEAGRTLPPDLTFIGGHPLAGSARQGIAFARPDLFRGRPWLFTPDAGAPPDALARLFAFVRALGAVPSAFPSAAQHDHLLAYLSHLPQLVASALMETVGDVAGEEGLALAGRGLADTTRLASSPGDVWRELCAANADEIGQALDRLVDRLRQLRADLPDGRVLTDVFANANRWRERLTK